MVHAELEGHGARLIGVNDETDKAEMLMNGRVDIISGMVPDTALVFESLGGDIPVYNAALVLNEVPITFVCHKSEMTIDLVRALNIALETVGSLPHYRERMAKANLAQGRLANSNDTSRGKGSPD